MKNKHLILFTIVLISQSVKAQSYDQAKEIKNQIGRDIGAFEESCSSLAKVISDYSYLSSSKCLYSNYSMDTVKQMIDIQFSNELSGPWTKTGNVYTNSIIHKNAYFNVSISNSGRSGNQKTLVIINDAALYKEVQTSTALREVFIAGVGIPKNLNVSKPEKNKTYFSYDDLNKIANMSTVGKNTFLIQINNHKIQIMAGSKIVKIDGIATNFEYAPFIKSSILYIPSGLFKIAKCKTSFIPGSYSFMQVICEDANDFVSLSSKF